MPPESYHHTDRIRKRGPTGKSCLECRRRKVKCDFSQPCQRCRAGGKSCIYQCSDTRFADEQSVIYNPPSFTFGEHVEDDTVVAQSTQLRGIDATYQTKVGRWSNGPSQDSSRPLTDDSSGTMACSTSSAAQNSAAIATSSRLSSQRFPQSILPTSAPRQNRVDNDELGQFRLRDGSGTLNKTRLFGRSHWDSTVQELASLQTAFNEAVGKTTRDADSNSRVAGIRTLNEECKVLARQIKTHTYSKLAYKAHDLQFPSHSVSSDLAQLYITRFESAFRILHIPSFLADFQSFLPQNPDATAPVIRLQLALVVAIATPLYQGREATEESLRCFAFSAVYAAQDWLAGLLEKDRLTIRGLQLQCLLVLARQTLAVGSGLIWISIGSILRMAMQMGLHRDPCHFPHMGVLEMQLRRRLWVTILEFNVQSALESGMPSLISLDDFDTEPPADINDADIDERTSSIHIAEPSHDTTDTSVQLVLWSCIRARLDVVRCLNNLSEDLTYEEVLSTSQEIERACKRCAQLVQRQEGLDTGRSCGTVFQRNYAEYLLRRFLLPLHRPFSNRCRVSPVFYFSKKLSSDTALAVIWPAPDDDFKQLLKTTGGPIRDCVHHASLILGLELVRDVEESQGSRHLTSVNSQLEMMTGAFKTAIEIEYSRLQHRETNVKLHLWLSMIMEYVKGVGRGIPDHEPLLQRAKDSLENSHRTLLQRWSSRTVVGLEGCSEVPTAPLDFGVSDWSSDLAATELFELSEFPGYYLDFQ